MAWLFYPERLPEQMLKKNTPASFCFAAKGSRFLTHMKKLRDAEPAFEFRNPTWNTGAVYDLLGKHNLALCIFDLGRIRA